MRNNYQAELFLKELFGEDYTEEQCQLTSKIVAGIAARFTSCAINFNLECPQFTPAVDSNFLLKFSNDLLQKKEEE